MSDTQTSKRDRQKARRQERLEAQAKAAKAQRRNGLMLRIAAVVFGVAVIGGLAVLLAQGTDRTLGVASAVLDGDPVPPVTSADGPAEAGVGLTVPDATGFSPDGEEVTIGATGTAQAVVFMAHWCPHCQTEVPLVVDWVSRGLLPDDVDLVAVSSRHDPARPNWPPDEWLEREDWPGELLIDHDDSVADAWGLQGTPMWTFVNPDGTIAARYAGQIDEAAFTQGIDALSR